MIWVVAYFGTSLIVALFMGRWLAHVNDSANDPRRDEGQDGRDYVAEGIKASKLRKIERMRHGR